VATTSSAPCSKAWLPSAPSSCTWPTWRWELASQTDPLTGLHNRRYLSNQIPADLACYERENRRHGGQDNTPPFALVDIDHHAQRDVTESGAMLVGLDAPVVGEFKLGMIRVAAIADKGQCVFEVRIFRGTQQFHAQHLGVEINRALKVANAHHCV